ncbi:MAG TPA: polysaccharide deacetylase family protein [Phycisphaerae bacterium]|nr:polysaccharide deacetylase family protein [Phycisphaerae bacterium]
MNTYLAKTEFAAWPGRLMRRLRRRRNDLCINIVAYHSIAQETNVLTAGTDLRHDPAEFERHLDYLVEHYRPVSLSELVTGLESGRPPRRAVVITIDDGFADSIRQAAAILFRRRIPATIFPVTSVIGNTDLMWQHKLAWLLANGHESLVRDALRAEHYPAIGEGESIVDFTRRCFRADLPDILECVLRRTGGTGRELAGRMRPYLEPEDIAHADRQFVEFGNHTHTHPVLSALTIEQQRAEIVTARDAIISLAGRPPFALAYPFGLKRHYNTESQRVARETGHRAALDLRRRINVGRVHPFELSRKPAPRGSLENFEKLIEDWPANAPLPPPGGIE